MLQLAGIDTYQGVRLWLSEQLKLVPPYMIEDIENLDNSLALERFKMQRAAKTLQESRCPVRGVELTPASEVERTSLHRSASIIGQSRGPGLLQTLSIPVQVDNKPRAPLAPLSLAGPGGAQTGGGVQTLGALLNEAYISVNRACPSNVTERADLRHGFLQQLAEYKQVDPTKLPTSEQQRKLQGIIQTSQDIQAQTNTVRYNS